jgi:cation diffusion facilitator CzcD-associated flavoprotein CzcO
VGPGRVGPGIVIVGAGFAGIGVAALLKRAGIDSFTIYEKAEGVGGAWWHNIYPGAEVDTHSFMYSFPFKPYPWSRTHARQAEVQGYLAETVEDYDLGRHLHLGVGVDSAVWDEQTHTYQLTLDTGEEVICQVLVGATGFLNMPKYPTWPGLETFRGPAFHTARWETQWDLSDKTVAVVGTGSTGIQLVPELAKIVKKLYVFQREPGWIVAKGDHDYGPVERTRLANRWWYRWERLKFLRFIEKIQFTGDIFTPGTAANDAARASALAFIERELGDRPDLQKLVTPDYPYWGKRTILHSTFYQSLKNDNVELVPRAVASVTETGVVDADGEERAVDALIMATGFQPTNYLGTMSVRGRDGRTLQEYWAGAPRAFVGITVPTFPNFFIMYGPGTNGGEIVSMLMAQARYIVRAARRMAGGKATAIEVKRLWADVYDDWLQNKLRTTSFAVSRNYYRVPSGRVVTQWPYSPVRYMALVRLLGDISEERRTLQ